MIELDEKLTLLINSFHNIFWDDFFFVFTGQLFWLPLAASIIYAIIKTYGKQSIVPLLFIFLLILAADQISSSLIKPLFERLRPSHNPELVDLIHNVHGYKGGKYGFVSSHAANSFAFAVFSSLLFRNALYTFVISSWACITAYSRVYLGVHYLGDILAGALLGVPIALLLYKLFVYVINKSNLSLKNFDKILVLTVLSTYILSIITLLFAAKYLIFMS